MAESKEEIITQTEFAKRVGVSEASIRKAVKSGRIDKGFYRNNDGKPRIRYQTALVEWHESSGGLTRPPTPEGQHTPNGVIATGKNGESIPDQVQGDGLPELNRKHKKLQIASTAFDLKVKQGLYVEKEVVYRALFGAGQEVRQAVEAIPDRVVDEMLGAEDRNEAHQILVEEINKVLGLLSGLGGALDAKIEPNE